MDGEIRRLATTVYSRCLGRHPCRRRRRLRLRHLCLRRLRVVASRLVVRRFVIVVVWQSMRAGRDTTGVIDGWV